jgi:hypothetical protein
MAASERAEIPPSPDGSTVDHRGAYAIDRLTETFARHIGRASEPCVVTDAERHEVADVCETMAALMGRSGTDQVWRTLTAAAEVSTNARHLVDREAFKGACIMLAVATMWEDTDPDSHDFDAVLPELRKVCARYYRDEDAWHSFEGMRTFLTYDHMFRDSPVARALCSASLEQYFRFRVTDFFLDAWLRVSYPIYRDAMFAEHCKSGLAARMTVRPTVVANDALTFAREKSKGEFVNCFHLAPPDDGADFRRFFDGILDGIVDDITCIKNFDPVTRDVLLNVIYGNFIFHRDFYGTLEVGRGL